MPYVTDFKLENVRDVFASYFNSRDPSNTTFVHCRDCGLRHFLGPRLDLALHLAKVTAPRARLSELHEVVIARNAMHEAVGSGWQKHIAHFGRLRKAHLAFLPDLELLAHLHVLVILLSHLHVLMVLRSGVGDAEQDHAAKDNRDCEHRTTIFHLLQFSF